MRGTLLSILGWLGLLQSWSTTPWSLETFGRIAGIAGVLGTLTVLVYRLGIWRQEMENTKNNVAAEVKASREESAANFSRVERRFDAIDHLVTMTSEQQGRFARWQARAERRLERLELASAE